jgi:hypothetical protein
MREFTMIVLFITFMVYTLNITGFSFKKFVLLESCVKDEPIDIAFWLIYAISLILFIFIPEIGKYTIFNFLFLCICGQYYFTFRYFFKPDPKKIEGYNNYFKENHHIILPSEKRLIPDTYHIIIFTLLIVNFLNTIIYLFIS